MICSGASVAVGRSDLRDAWYNFSFIKLWLYCSLWGDKQLAVKALGGALHFPVEDSLCVNFFWRSFFLLCVADVG